MRSLTSDLADAIAQARLRTLDLAEDYDLDVAHALACILFVEHRRVVDLTHALDFDLNRASHLVLEVADSLRAMCELDLTHVLARDLAKTVTDALDIGHAAGIAGTLASDLEPVTEPARNDFVRGRQKTAQVTPAAGRLAATAVRLLPVPHRARYAEELESELWALASADARRQAQLAYAVRQVLSAFQLRRELRKPRQRGAAP